jgi:hypothetical protein
MRSMRSIRSARPAGMTRAPWVCLVVPLASCAMEMAVPPATQIACATDADCPPDNVCRTGAKLCGPAKDATPPTVDSMSRAGASPTSAARVGFAVVFSEYVLGVDVTDFDAVLSGTLASATVSGVEGEGTTYTVQVDVGSGDGELRLRLLDDDTIVDEAGNPLLGAGPSPATTSTDFYQIARQGPTVSGLERDGTGPRSGDEVGFHVTFSEPVTGVDATDFAATLSGSLHSALVTQVSGAGTDYYVRLGIGGGDGEVRLRVLDDDSIIDADGNPLAGEGDSGGATSTDSYLMDRTPPGVAAVQLADASPTSDGSVTFNVLFSEPVTGVDASDFAAALGGGVSSATVSLVTGETTTYSITFALGAGDGTVALSVLDDNSIVDQAGNPLDGLEGNFGMTSSVAYEVTYHPPVVVGIGRPDWSPTDANEVSFEVTFSKPVTGVDAADFTVLRSGSLASASVAEVSGGPTQYLVRVGLGTGDGEVRLRVLDDDTIVDAGGEPLNGQGPGWAGTSDAYLVVRSAPIVRSVVRHDPSPTKASTVAFDVTFSEAVTYVDNYDFEPVASGGLGQTTISSVTGSGAAYVVSLAVGSGSGELRLRVRDDNTIRGADGDPLAGLGTNGGVTSREAYVVDRLPPYVVTLDRVDTNPTYLAEVDYLVTFSEPVVGVDPTDFSVAAPTTFTGASVADIAGSGAVYIVTVDTGQGVGALHLDLADDGSITDLVGNALVAGDGSADGAFAGQAYTIRMLEAARLDSVANPSGLAIVGNRLYVTDSAGLSVVDISTPESPTLLGSCDTPGAAYKLAVLGNYAYVTYVSDVVGVDVPRGLAIVDVSAPAAPVVRSTFDTDGMAYAVAVAGNYVYLAGDEIGLVIVDVSDPDVPTLAAHYDDLDGEVRAVVVVGTRAYVTDGDVSGVTAHGLVVLDVTNPRSPSTLTVIREAGESNWLLDVAVAGGYAYMLKGAQLVVLDLACVDSGPPCSFHHANTGYIPRRVSVTARYAYLLDPDTSGSGLAVVGLSAPMLADTTATCLPDNAKGYCPGASYARDVLAAGGYIYLAGYERLIVMGNPFEH